MECSVGLGRCLVEVAEQLEGELQLFLPVGDGLWLINGKYLNDPVLPFGMPQDDISQQDHQVCIIGIGRGDPYMDLFFITESFI